MAYDLSGVDIYFLAKELKTLEGSKVDKITQLDRKLFLFRFFRAKEKTNVRLLVPELVNITNHKYTSPLLPMGFCTFLRKYLQNAKLVKVEQKGFERILLFQFESSKYGSLALILELFKPGNMILCKVDEEGKLIILNALERQEFKTRKVESREEYIFPPQKIDPLNLPNHIFREFFTSTDKTLGKILAVEMSLGGIYAQEIIERSGLDKDSKKLNESEEKLIAKEIKNLFLENINSMKSKDKIFPVQMKSVTPDLKFDSFNAGLDSVPIEIVASVKKLKEAKAKSSKTASLLELQLKRVRQLEREIKEAQEIGEFVYEHYQEFNKLLLGVKEMRERGKSYNEIEEVLKKNKHFKKIDKASKKIYVEFK